MASETVMISVEDFEYFKRLEQAAQDELRGSIRRGLADAAHGRIRAR